MGMCCCKQKNEEQECYVPQISANQDVNVVLPPPSPVISQLFCNRTTPIGDPTVVDKLILDTLGVIETLVDNEQEPPSAMLHLHNIADNEEGWIQVVTSMVKVIPLADPLGPSVITLLLDDCPLPSKESIIKVVDMFQLSHETALKERNNPTRQRNTCVALGSIAEKLAGPRNMEILNDGVIDYLLTNLEPETNPNVILFSLIALEKFAQSSQNKVSILNKLKKINPSPICLLESWKDETNFVKRQAGFCAQWILDNVCKYSACTLVSKHLFIMDTSEYMYLKIKYQLIDLTDDEHQKPIIFVC